MLFALLLVVAAAPKVDQRLVGTWQLSGSAFMTLNANGTGVMEGDPLKWKADGATLSITDEDGEVEKLPFQINGDTLTINMGGMPLQLSRGGAPVAKTGKLQRAAEKRQEGDADAEAMAMAQKWMAAQQQGGQQQQQAQQPQVKNQPAGNDQLSKLLLSSNWCWLRYSNGNSYTQKVHFNANGTWQDFSESDIYSNNSGNVAQAVGNRQSGGQWAVKGGVFYLSSPDQPQLQPVQLNITRNSNGYPIINADGREYSMCN